MTTEFPTDQDKATFATQLAHEMKEKVVQEQGIGSDVTFGLLGWKEGTLVGCCTVGAPLMQHPRTKFESLCRAGLILRRCFGAEAITFICDGYAAAPGDENSESATDRYAAGDPGVTEAILSTHVDKWNPVVACTMHRYKVGVGRSVEWLDTYTIPLGFEGTYPHALATVLNGEVIADPATAYQVFDGLSYGIHTMAPPSMLPNYS